MRKVILWTVEGAVVLSLFVVFFVVQLPGLNMWVAVAALLFVGVVLHAASLAPSGRIAGWVAIALLAAALVVGYGFLRYMQLDPASYADEQWNTALPEGKRPLAIHLSDLHFIGKASGKTFQGRDWNESVVSAAVAEIARLSPRYLIVSGDVTDTGSAEEWEQAQRVLLDPLARTPIEIVISPGNHDLQPAFNYRQQYISASERLVRVFKAANSANSRLLTAKKREVGEILNEPISNAERDQERSRQYMACTDACAAMAIENPRAARSCIPGCGKAMESFTPERLDAILEGRRFQNACREWYPLRYVSKDRQAEVLALCSSVDETEGIGTNGIGSLGNTQLTALEAEFAALPSTARYLFVVMHHSPVKRPNDHFGLFAKGVPLSESTFFHYLFLGNAVGESQRIVRALHQAAKSHPSLNVHLAYGHRHQTFAGKIDNPSRDGGRFVWLTEAPALYEPDGGMWIGYEMETGGRIDWRWRAN